MTFKGGAAWRERLTRDLGRIGRHPGAARRSTTTTALARLMTNLGGHDLDGGARGVPRRRGRPAALLHRLHDQGLRPAVRRPQGQPRRADDARPDGGVQAGASDRRTARSGSRSPASTSSRTSWQRSWPAVPFARAHRDMRPTRRCRCRRACRPGGRCAAARPRRRSAGSWASWRAATSALAARIITTSPDVTVSTNLGAWVSRRSVFNRADARRRVQGASRSPRPSSGRRAGTGQHVELGIAENNLFLMLAALGLAGAAVRRSGCCRSARSTIRSSRAASMR